MEDDRHRAGAFLRPRARPLWPQRVQECGVIGIAPASGIYFSQNRGANSALNDIRIASFEFLDQRQRHMVVLAAGSPVAPGHLDPVVLDLFDGSDMAAIGADNLHVLADFSRVDHELRLHRQVCSL